MIIYAPLMEYLMEQSHTEAILLLKIIFMVIIVDILKREMPRLQVKSGRSTTKQLCQNQGLR